MGRGEEGKVIVPKCCFCIDLKTGVLILGIICSILSGIGVIAYIAALVGK